MLWPGSRTWIPVAMWSTKAIFVLLLLIYGLLQLVYTVHHMTQPKNAASAGEIASRDMIQDGADQAIVQANISSTIFQDLQPPEIDVFINKSNGTNNTIMRQILHSFQSPEANILFHMLPIPKTSLQNVIPTENPFIVEPTVAPEQPQPDMVVFVQSKPNNLEHRRRIRNTWGYTDLYRDVNLKVVFTMGYDKTSVEATQAVMSEATVYQDVLLLNMEDKYDFLTIKGLLTQTWILSRFPKVKYIMKVDDDVLINMYKWIKIVKSDIFKRPTCALVCFEWAKPLVQRTGKYAVSNEQYPQERYPSFCSGAAYVMSRNSLLAIMQAARNIPLFIRDDPYFTGLSALAAGVIKFGVPRNSVAIYPEDLDTVARSSPASVILLHGAGAELWTSAWDHFVNQKTPLQLVLKAYSTAEFEQWKVAHTNISLSKNSMIEYCRATRLVQNESIELTL